MKTESYRCIGECTSKNSSPDFPGFNLNTPLTSAPKTPLTTNLLTFSSFPPPFVPHPLTIGQRKTEAPEREIKKRNNLTYVQKREIVQLINKGETKRSVGNNFGINESTV